MSSNHAAPPPPEPGPLCAIVDPLLALLALGELEPAEAASTNEHLADCAWCQQRLREYETVHAALHRTYAPALPDAPAAAVSWPEIVRIEEMDEADGLVDAQAATSITDTTNTRAHRAQQSRGFRIATSIGALAAAVLIIVLLGALLGWQRGIGVGTPQPTPTLDPQTRAYVMVLRTYYEPLFVATSQDEACEATYSAAAASAKLNALVLCRPTSAAVASDAQALADHLRSAVPPARWQEANDELKAAIQTTIDVYTARVAAIDARNTSQFDALISQAHATLGQYCAPIALINAGLPPSEGINAPNLMC